MNENFKFRIFNHKTKKWVHGPGEEVYLFGETILLGVFMNGVSLVDLNFCEVFPFTGLKDINEKEIYRGDIVKKLCKTKNLKNEEILNDNSLPPFEVKWNQQHCGFGITVGNRHVYKVIGNICDNP